MMLLQQGMIWVMRSRQEDVWEDVASAGGCSG